MKKRIAKKINKNPEKYTDKQHIEAWRRIGKPRITCSSKHYKYNRLLWISGSEFYNGIYRIN